MLWFSSDWHLGHSNIAGPKVSKWPSGYRNFETVKEMDETIINTMNKYLQYGDTLYFLGDFCLSPQHRKGYRSRILVETIHFIKGNHDKHIERYAGEGEGKLYKPTFSSIQNVVKITNEGTTIFMSHYGHRVWPHSHRGCIHLYGHSHSNLPDLGKSMDVGVDNAYKLFGEWRPFNFDEIVALMSKKELYLPDHHGHRDGDN